MPITDEAGNHVGALEIQRNVTDEAVVQVKYQEMLETEARERERLANQVRDAHQGAARDEPAPAQDPKRAARVQEGPDRLTPARRFVARAGCVAVVVCGALAGCAHAPDLLLEARSGATRGLDDRGLHRTRRHAAARAALAPVAPAVEAGGPAPAAGNERGVLVIMHGLKDYSGRYAAFATQAAARGYSVYAFDLRGHGRSAGPRVAPRHWSEYVDDLDRFLTLVQQREPGKPVFLFGHSMGGAIAARAAEIHQPHPPDSWGSSSSTPPPAPIAGLILSGAALAIDAPPLLLAVTRMSGALMPGFPALKLDNHDFSSDPAAAAAMDKDHSSPSRRRRRGPQRDSSTASASSGTTPTR